MIEVTGVVLRDSSVPECKNTKGNMVIESISTEKQTYLVRAVY